MSASAAGTYRPCRPTKPAGRRIGPCWTHIVRSATSSCRGAGPDGSARHVLISGDPVFDDNGAFTGYRGVGVDISERKSAEARVAYLNRIYAMLSGTNALIARALDRDELFTEACRIAVAAGGFRMAWIAIVDRAR